MKRQMDTLQPSLVLWNGKHYHEVSASENNAESLMIWRDYKPVGLSYDYCTWPGAYPIFYLTADNSVLCPRCANDNMSACACPEDSAEADPFWRLVAACVNYEDDSLYCDHCWQRIESAYCEVEK